MHCLCLLGQTFASAHQEEDLCIFVVQPEAVEQTEYPAFQNYE